MKNDVSNINHCLTFEQCSEPGEHHKEMVCCCKKSLFTGVMAKRVGGQKRPTHSKSIDYKLPFRTFCTLESPSRCWDSRSHGTATKLWNEAFETLILTMQYCPFSQLRMNHRTWKKKVQPHYSHISVFSYLPAPLSLAKITSVQTSVSALTIPFGVFWLV